RGTACSPATGDDRCGRSARCPSACWRGARPTPWVCPRCCCNPFAASRQSPRPRCRSRVRTVSMHDTWPLLRDSDFPRITRGRLQTLLLNLGYLCNLSCIHCHVAAGPRRTELMDRPTMALALAVAERHAVATLDVTGGSPEMNPDFRWLVGQAREAGLHV